MTSRIRVPVRLPLLLAALCVMGPGQDVSFEREVLPLLSDRCFACHGPDEASRRADLRLDVAAEALRETDPVIVPGNAAGSELVRRIRSRDAADRMPPPDSHVSLSEQEIETLARWIDEGARWGRHWAWQLPATPPRPTVRDTKWPRNAVDRFVLAALERDGLTPNAAAPRSELLRRVTLDLTGLPPTLGELDAFLADRRDGAYGRVVDRLLASPRYAERMAWEWLDAARYADTDGFQNDPTRDMWPWRDWLVRSLHANKPFDRLTLEMLAGDLLADATDDQILATAFNRNHMHNGEGGRIAEETRIENVFDRAETTATVWLGITLTCARCHDHKYDPVSQDEYYRFFAFFNQTSETGRGGGGKAPPTLRYVAPSVRARRDTLDARIADLDRRMNAPDPTMDAAQATWEARIRPKVAREFRSMKPAKLGPWWVRAVLPAPDENANRIFGHVYAPERAVVLDEIDAIGKPVWSKRNLADGRPHALSREIGATFLRRTLTVSSDRTLTLSLGSDDAIKVWVDGKRVLAKNVRRGVKADQERVSVPLEAGRHELLMEIINTGGASGFYFRVVEETIAGLARPIAKALATGPSRRSNEQRRLIRRHYRSRHAPSWKALATEKTRLEKERRDLVAAAPRPLVMDQLPADKRRKTRVLERGGYDQPKHVVDEGTPAFLPPLPPDAPRNRLGLARWLVSGNNPLTARVAVNRAWQLFFGTGFVSTPEDFGVQGERPSHPRLLDWLASWFVTSGWDTKALHRLIVTSATYRQSARSATGYRDDPDNRRLARGPRHRLPSWMLRDQALAASGLLVERVGGPPVRPYQPEGVWAEATFEKIKYRRDEGDALYRRSLYVFWRRIVGPTVFFDVSKRQLCTVDTTRTNSPLHALTTLNETAYVEAARKLAERMMREGGATPSERIAFAFRALVARAPDAFEARRLLDRWTAARATFAADPARARALLAVGEAPAAADLDPTELAAYAIIGSILLNLDETLSKP